MQYHELRKDKGRPLPNKMNQMQGEISRIDRAPASLSDNSRNLLEEPNASMRLSQMRKQSELRYKEYLNTTFVNELSLIKDAKSLVHGNNILFVAGMLLR